MNNTPTPRTDEIAMIRKLIPDWDDVMDKLSKHEKINPIEQFVWDYAPSDSESNEWEKALFKSIKFLKERELAALTEQRDRLAEAIEHTMKHMRHSLNCPARLSEGLHACNCQMEWSYDNAAESLQSLNPDHTVDANDMTAAVKGGADEIPR